jgi:hypothetical protein
MLGHSSRAFPNGALPPAPPPPSPSPPPPPPPSTPPPFPLPPPSEEKHSDDSFQEFLNELDEKHKGRPPPKEVQAALLRSFETVRQEPNDSTAVYDVEDVDLNDGEDVDLEDSEDADLEDGRRRHAALLAKRRREAPPTTLALLHRQMVRGRMERRYAKTKRVAHREREDGTKTAHDIDAGLSGASNDDNNDGEAAA